MKKLQPFFNKIDALPLVKLLQIVAVLIFIFGIIPLLLSINIKLFDYYGNARWEVIWHDVMIFAMGIIHVLYQPLILLALAEIIKLMRVKNDQN